MFVLQTNATNTGIGAVLAERIGEEHPVTYESRNLSPAEQQYLTVEREDLALKGGGIFGTTSKVGSLPSKLIIIHFDG